MGAWKRDWEEARYGARERYEEERERREEERWEKLRKRRGKYCITQI